MNKIFDGILGKMSIYESSAVRPYVYFGINRITGEMYAGYREANILPSDVDLYIYRTSSHIVRPRFNEFDWIIVAEFFTGSAAYDFEQEMIYSHWGNPLLLNKHHHYTGNRFKSPIGVKKGPQTPEHKRNLSIAHKGKKLGPQSAERKALTSKANKGRKLGTSWNAGIKTGPQSIEFVERRVAALRGRTRPKSICPHCGTEGEMGNMKRWHNDNCKHKGKSINDDRL